MKLSVEDDYLVYTSNNEKYFYTGTNHLEVSMFQNNRGQIKKLPQHVLRNYLKSHEDEF